MVTLHMRTRHDLASVLLPSSATNLTERAPLIPFLLLLPSIQISLVRRPFCFCKARAGKVVSSAFGRLIALAYSTKFGRAVPLSGTDARVLHPHPCLPPSLRPQPFRPHRLSTFLSSI